MFCHLDGFVSRFSISEGKTILDPNTSRNFKKLKKDENLAGIHLGMRLLPTDIGHHSWGWSLGSRRREGRLKMESSRWTIGSPRWPCIHDDTGTLVGEKIDMICFASVCQPGFLRVFQKKILIGHKNSNWDFIDELLFGSKTLLNFEKGFFKVNVWIIEFLYFFTKKWCLLRKIVTLSKWLVWCEWRARCILRWSNTAHRMNSGLTTIQIPPNKRGPSPKRKRFRQKIASLLIGKKNKNNSE